MIHSEPKPWHDERRERLRGAIQTAALACFTDKGLGGATMAEIARLAGVSPGALYLHFKSKQELFASLGRPDLDQPAARVRERRTQILTAALKTFSEKGYSAATMDEIAAGAGLSKAALYGHFESKEELFVGVLRDAAFVDEFERLWACHRAERFPEQPTARDPYEYLLQYATAFLRAHRDPQHLELMRFVLTEGMRDVNVAAVIFEKMARKTSLELAAQLVKLGLGTQDELGMPAQALTGMLFSWVLTHRVLAQPPVRTQAGGPAAGRATKRLDGDEETKVAKQVVRLFLYGLSGYTSALRKLKRNTKRQS